MNELLTIEDRNKLAELVVQEPPRKAKIESVTKKDDHWINITYAVWNIPINDNNDEVVDIVTMNYKDAIYSKDIEFIKLEVGKTYTANELGL